MYIVGICRPELPLVAVHVVPSCPSPTADAVQVTLAKGESQRLGLEARGASGVGNLTCTKPVGFDFRALDKYGKIVKSAQGSYIDTYVNTCNI